MPTAVDLFCGSGAVSWGLKQAGFDVLGAIDFDSTACTTYRVNHPEVQLLEQDIKKIDPVYLLNVIGNRSVDLLAVCAPCQPFSSQNRKKSQYDTRSLLVLEALKFVEILNPEIVFFENVPNLGKRPVFKDLAIRLTEKGYFLSEPQRINAADYGVPQRRERMILIGAKSEMLLSVAQKIQPQQRQTVFDAIGNLPLPPIGNPSCSGDKLHYARRHSSLNIERLRHIPPDGGSRDALPEHLVLACHKKLEGKKNSFLDTYGRMKWHDVAPTLTTGCTDITRGRYAHPVQDRAITLREAARLQSFPDNYSFIGNSAQIATQIGNAVPPKMMATIAQSLYSALEHVDERCEIRMENG